MVEFSFDVVQVAAMAYAPEAYHSFIGFQVAKPLLERAFSETYGIQMKGGHYGLERYELHGIRIRAGAERRCSGLHV
jgi:hypothetical protein